MIKCTSLPDREAIASVVNYCPDTGRFTWRDRPREHFKTEAQFKTWAKRFAGREAGSVRVDGYVRLLIGGKRLLAHRVAFLMMTGEQPPMLDHINRDRSDNRYANLRPADYSLNMRNASTRRDNTSGRKGVYRVGDKWTARIRNGGEQVSLGRFATHAEAVGARREAEARFGYAVIA